ncbi:MAG: sodium:alanine symporter family protein [Pseudomonadota bacterium]
MEFLTNFISGVNSFVWGPPMLTLILFTGLVLSFGLAWMPIRRVGYGFRLMLTKPETSHPGEIAPFKALMTSLSATVGVGNIAGVATAISLGGPGALFWMWMTALVGMATKYAEAVCAVRYREQDEEGRFVGGPMYYIRKGLGDNWAWLAFAFALFGTIAGFGIGNAVQANSVAVSLETWGINAYVTGAVLVVIVGAVLFFGLKGIATVASAVVPFMGILYVVVGLIVLLLNITAIPAAVGLIIQQAFSGDAVMGGGVGTAIAMGIRFGVARGVFSNEAGLGSAAIAHAAASTDNPVRQGTVAMLGTFIDTLVVCTITGLVIVTAGLWQVQDAAGNLMYQSTVLTSTSFGKSLAFGDEFVTLIVPLFAFTTILGWSYYSERCLQYIAGAWAIMPFRVAWVIVVFIGAVAADQLTVVWLIADTLNAMMAVPNLVGLLLLSPVVFSLTQEHFKSKDGAT